nr:WD repeat-containing protein 44-like [Tanacetum cinerariifolium]
MGTNESKSKRDVKKSGPLAQAPNDTSLAKKSSQFPPVPKKSIDKGTNRDSKQPCDIDSSVGESFDGSLQPDGGNNAMISNSSNVPSTAWGLVIVTAGVSGAIRVYQNVGLPVKTRTFALGDKPHFFFAPEGKPSRRGLNPRPLACGNNLPKCKIKSQIWEIKLQFQVWYKGFTPSVVNTRDDRIR